MSALFKTSQEAFIGKHITSRLEDDGYKPFEISKAVEHAINFYRSNARFARGKVFDECLTRARQLLAPKASKRTTKAKAK